MARLSSEMTAMVNQLKQKSLDVIDAATAAAFYLNEKVGETQETLAIFDELQAAAEDAKDSCSRLYRLELAVAESQPGVPSEVLELLSRTIEYTTSRIPAWERSIEEIKLEFELP